VAITVVGIMGKRKTPMSEIWQKRCVKPERKMKNESLKNNDLSTAIIHSVKEMYCITQRENSKND